ncbi:hypothetical protein LIER_11369 [Lithospermum erythrorhizon]|uniref:Zinc finger, CCHC-type n=1 Tax=Lithospermum erythrorhizon TaxID=34254 RepID=A0AAV3PPK8_LITER
MSVDELQSTLSLHERKFKRHMKEESDQVLQVESKFGAMQIENRLGTKTGRGKEVYRSKGPSNMRGKGNQQSKYRMLQMS